LKEEREKEQISTTPEKSKRKKTRKKEKNKEWKKNSKKIKHKAKNSSLPHQKKPNSKKTKHPFHKLEIVSSSFSLLFLFDAFIFQASLHHFQEKKRQTYC